MSSDYTPGAEKAESGLDRPCNACPWVSTDPRDREAIADPATQASMKAGSWFCCHVNLGTCHGARLQHEKHQRQEARHG